MHLTSLSTIKLYTITDGPSVAVELQFYIRNPYKNESKFEMAFIFRNEIPLKHCVVSKFGVNTNADRLSFIGWMVGKTVGWLL